MHRSLLAAAVLALVLAGPLRAEPVKEVEVEIEIERTPVTTYLVDMEIQQTAPGREVHLEPRLLCVEGGGAGLRVTEPSGPDFTVDFDLEKVTSSLLKVAVRIDGADPVTLLTRPGQTKRVSIRDSTRGRATTLAVKPSPLQPRAL